MQAEWPTGKNGPAVWPLGYESHSRDKIEFDHLYFFTDKDLAKVFAGGRVTGMAGLRPATKTKPKPSPQ